MKENIVSKNQILFSVRWDDSPLSYNRKDERLLYSKRRDDRPLYSKTKDEKDDLGRDA